MLTQTHRFLSAVHAGVAMALACLAAQGCQRAANTFDATVQGAVTIDGELAPRGTVTFHPAKRGAPSSGPIHEDGSYSLRTGQGDLSNPDGGTIRSGEYVVTVIVTAPPSADEVVAEGGPPSVGARLMADKYATKETSDLNVKVKAGPNIIDFKLDGPWANPPKEESSDDADVEAGPDGVSEDEAEEGESEDTPAAEETDATDVDAAGGDAEPAEEPAAPPSGEAVTPADEPVTTEGQP
jgi:hypothetical protein